VAAAAAAAAQRTCYDQQKKAMHNTRQLPEHKGRAEGLVGDRCRCVWLMLVYVLWCGLSHAASCAFPL
jgi:hypothetical protein